MTNDPFNYLKEILATPLGDMIASVGEGVAEAQAALDAGSLAQTLAIYDHENKEEVFKQLRAIGYQPTFYTLPDTKVKAKIALTITQSSHSVASPATDSGQKKAAIAKTNFINASALTSARATKTKLYATPLNASTTNRFNMQYQASVELEFTIKAVPPPPGAEIRLVPKVTEKTFEEAVEILSQLNLNYDFKEETMADFESSAVLEQVPSAGEILRADEVVVLTLKEIVVP